MTRNNLFDGESYYAMFAQVTYKWLISRKWFTYADIMADYLGLKSANELTCSISKCDNYGELRKALPDVLKAIENKVGKGGIEVKGNNGGRSYRYVGEDADPLADMRNAKTINDLRRYWQFCQDSSGFFPISWLEYFFKDCRDLLEIKSKRQKGEQILSSSMDRILTNVELLPYLYESIANKQVLLVDYKPYDMDVMHLTFHPHYLKEFNGRWHLLGHAEGYSPELGFDLALDRIVNKPREDYQTEYMPAPAGFYNDLFMDMVGLSNWKDSKKETVVVRAHSNYIYNLMATKKMHQSQEISMEFGHHDDGTYGEFTLQVKLNNELIGRILHYGSGLEVVSPPKVREVFKSRISEMANLYHDRSEQAP